MIDGAVLIWHRRSTITSRLAFGPSCLSYSHNDLRALGSRIVGPISSKEIVMASKRRIKETVKKPMDSEFLARIAHLRRQTEGRGSTNSPQESLALLRSSTSIVSNIFSESLSVASFPSVVEFPPTPVFTDEIPAGIMRKFELSVAPQIPKTPASMNSYPLQNSQPVTVTQSLNATHDEASSSTTSSDSNSALKQQQPMKLPAPTTKSVPHYTPPRQTPTSTPITPLPLPQSSNHSPPPMIPLETPNFKTWWNQFTLAKPPPPKKKTHLKVGPFPDSSFLTNQLTRLLNRSSSLRETS